MIAFIDEHSGQFFGRGHLPPPWVQQSVGSSPRVSYRAAKSRPASARALRNELLTEQICRIHEENYQVYGVRKIHQAMIRAGWEVGRDQVARLMRAAGIHGVRRGRKPVTTKPADQPDTRPDLVDRQFSAERPHQLWVVRHHLRQDPDRLLLESPSSPTYSPDASWAGPPRPACRLQGRRCSR
ncbi:MAG: IS3 family transposase [Micrococcus sp.]|nr:IS3 family transposase [Micrococcus sp.]